MDVRRRKFQYSAGVAAGMEFDDSGDEFMFGDDGFDSETEMFQPKLPKAEPKEETEQTPRRRAPWANDVKVNNITDKRPQMSCFTENHNDRTKRPSILSLEDEEIRAAINKGNVDYIKDVIQSGYDVNTKLKSGWTCLMYAAVAGYFDILKLLIDGGANVNFQKDLFTPLMAVCSTAVTSESRVNCAQYLIDAGARMNAHDRHLMTPLMYAAQTGQHEVVQLFINENADVNAQDNRGWTALAYAANSGHLSSVKILLQNKAINSLCAYDGQSPADLAYSKGFTNIASILEGAKADSNEQDTPSCSRSNFKSTYSRCKKLDELEMFLHGLNLGNLIELFQESQITFQDFLKLSDGDLEKIGVKQFGARKRILEAIRGVHTNEWDLSGLTADKQSKISTIEATAIAANVAKHLEFIRSSISFLRNYIENHKDTIQKDDPNTQKVLVDQCKTAHSKSCLVQDDLNLLQSFATMELPLAAKNQCDFIDGSKSVAHRTKRRIYILPLIGCLSVMAITVYKYYSR